MTGRVTLAVKKRYQGFARTPYGRLQRLFVERMFQGGGEPGSDGLEMGTGAILVLLAMPGAVASFLLFPKYGSLFHWIQGIRNFDPFKAAMEDEYFFIVLSVTVAGAAALWRWDNIFLDRRDYFNLVPLPISLRSIFTANLCAILLISAVFTIVVNGASLFLFPATVMGGDTNALIFRFAGGHAAAVLLAGAFSCFAVFAVSGVLMSMLPAAVFRRVSLIARFLIAVVLLGLLGSSFAVPRVIENMGRGALHRVKFLPPISFLGVAQSIWGRGEDADTTQMMHAAVGAVACAVLTAILAYAVSFRRSFLHIPEARDEGPLPRPRVPWSPFTPALNRILRTPAQRAVYRFAARTLTRSEAHLQILLGFLAVGLVASAVFLSSAANPRAILSGRVPPPEFLAVPFALSYCVVIGTRFAFEMPANLKANWIFRYSLVGISDEGRAIARWVLLVFSLAWIAPATFVVTAVYWGPKIATLHTGAVILTTAALVEALLARYRKVPFTCPPPVFKRNAGLVVMAYLFGFYFFTSYLPRLDGWSLLQPWRAICFALLLAIVIVAIHFYRKQLLAMDKDLIFEEIPLSEF
ncbi:MAG TPA: hypothetical protein VKR82_06775 [Candidatus Acidoferrales bacterium]|nr:hypothetical protein [Candidatus Acidoferrales bacterium]